MSILTSISDGDRARLVRFLDEVAAADRRPPLSEYKQLRLDNSRGTIERLLVGDGDVIIGYGQAAWHRPVSGSDGHWALEVVVAPEYRNGPTARRLVDSLEAGLGDSPMTLWAHTAYMTTAATEGGWQAGRILSKMTRPLPVHCLDEVPDELSVSTFRPGIDEEAWLTANNVAFAGHLENGALTMSDIEERESQPWFDPGGFFLAWDGDRVAGSCWTKVHAGNVGEIYIIGIIPEWEGVGLGRALVCRGLDYLGTVRHADSAMLYVEGRNERAGGMYAELGFVVETRITAYCRGT